MRPLVAILFGLSLSANAQNWALLNPAYKYNYSNDGTDTISNQIFVTQIDTLGPDSFRYELNRIGVVCDTCPASLGGPCDGCFIWVDQPQFLQRSAVWSGAHWWLLDPDTFLIRTDLQVGGTWLYHTDSSITATVIQREQSITWGTSDSLMIIGLSTGDSIVVSRFFGIQRFPGSSLFTANVQLGVHGPDVGQLLPEPSAYMDYEVGDVLEYTCYGSYYNSNAQPPDVFYEGRMKAEFDVRTALSDGYMAHMLCGTISLGAPIEYSCFWFGDPFTHIVNFIDATFADTFDPLMSYPGQVIGAGTCSYFPSIQQSWARCLAIHGLAADGRRTISTWSKVGPGQVEYGTISTQPVPSDPRLHPLDGCTSQFEFVEGIGLSHAFSYCSIGSWCELDLWGYALDGDTVGGLTPNDAFYGPLAQAEHADHVIPTLFPNPAAEEFTVNGIVGVKTLAIYDLEGRLVRTARIGSENETINVLNLQAGVYLLRIEGLRPQRLVIAR